MPDLPITHNPRVQAPRHIPPPRDDEPKRIRGRALQAIRSRILRRDPLCVRCKPKGILTATEVVDHITPLHLGGSDTDDNRQGLCTSCHNDKTAQEATARAANPIHRPIPKPCIIA